MKAAAIDIAGSFSEMPPLRSTTVVDASDEASAFTMLSEFGNGGVFASSFSGKTPWERHPGDELVVVHQGEAVLVLLVDGDEITRTLGAGQLFVVPALVWHRFETTGVRTISVTPQPTETSGERYPPSGIP